MYLRRRVRKSSFWMVTVNEMEKKTLPHTERTWTTCYWLTKAHTKEERKKVDRANDNNGKTVNFTVYSTVIYGSHAWLSHTNYKYSLSLNKLHLDINFMEWLVWSLVLLLFICASILFSSLSLSRIFCMTGNHDWLLVLDERQFIFRTIISTGPLCQGGWRALFV